ncbi:MAG: adenylate/guanylate cyclase domain-containing protein, partial [Kovacikia sp.]
MTTPAWNRAEAFPQGLKGQRVLAAIVFTDVVNFSAHMGANEERTLYLMQRDTRVMADLCQQFEGQVLKTTGDGLLMYFTSAVQAVECAIGIQGAIAEAATDLTPQDVLAHRIGIHLGDVFFSETDVMGSGVNIAARLQNKADPGGICISQTVYDVVKNQLELKATYLGPQELKNIRDPVPAYQILVAPLIERPISVAVPARVKPELISPYKGLKKFELEDRDQFFGRDQLVAGLVNELERNPLILLLGASGSGKSSVVRAGIFPRFLEKWGAHLVNLTFTPDEDPFESLYASLVSQYKQSDAKLVRQGKADTLTQTVKVLKRPGEHWLIFIDQFEELFTITPAEKRNRFVESLTQLAKAQDSTIKLILTMRADFLDRFSAYPNLGKLTQQQIRLMTDMQRDELWLAIKQPAARSGVVFETGLIEEILRDVQGQAGYLPLLQYTLDLLWESEHRNGSLQLDRTLHART